MPYMITDSKKDHLLPVSSLPLPHLATPVRKTKVRELPEDFQEAVASHTSVMGVEKNQLRASLLTPEAQRLGRPGQAGGKDSPLLIGPTWRMGGFGRVRPAWDGEPLAAKEFRLPEGRYLEREMGKQPKTQYTPWESIQSELTLMRAPFTSLQVKHVVRSDHKVFVFTPWLPLTGLDLLSEAHRRPQGGAYPLYLAHEMLAQIGEQAAALNASGYTHNDIKGENIFASARGPLKLVLGDLGLAERMDAAPEAELDWIGTPGYVSPERLRLDDDVGNTDAFSLAVLAIETIIGRHLLPIDPELDGDDLHRQMISDSNTLEDWHRAKFNAEQYIMPASNRLTLSLNDAYQEVANIDPATADFLFKRGLQVDPEQRFTCSEAARFGRRALARDPGRSRALGNQLVQDATASNKEISGRETDFMVLKSVAQNYTQMR